MRIIYRYIRPLPVIYARSFGPYQTASREAWHVLGSWLEARGARRVPKQAYGLFRDNPVDTPPERLRYEACVPLIPGLDADSAAGIGNQIVSGGAYAVHTHVGSYAGMGSRLSDLHREVVPARGLSVDYGRQFMAIYLNDPRYTREMHRRTELCIPVLPIRLEASADDWHADEAVPLPHLA